MFTDTYRENLKHFYNEIMKKIIKKLFHLFTKNRLGIAQLEGIYKLKPEGHKIINNGKH